MKFLTVLIIVFLYRNWIGGHPLRDRMPLRSYFDWFMARGIAVNVRYLLCVGLPVAIAFAISLKLGGWLLGLVWFAFALAVMLYAVDIYDEDDAFERQSEWLQTPGGDVDLDAMERRQEDFLLVTTYEIFQSIYPALFWFLIFGPGGALAYALSKQYLDALEDDDPELALVERAVYYLEWPAARISGLLFALLGHFGRCFDVWVETLGNMKDSIGTVLLKLARAAIDEAEIQPDTTIDSFTTDSDHTNQQLRSLMDRSLFGWLGVATIVAILGL